MKERIGAIIAIVVLMVWVAAFLLGLVPEAQLDNYVYGGGVAVICTFAIVMFLNHKRKIKKEKG